MLKTATKIRSFTDLIAWQEGHKLVLDVYQNVSFLPSSERFGLASQLQRASVSITSNIAEGFARKSAKEQIQFFYTALGSVKEVQNQLLICRDLQYIATTDFNRLAQRSVDVSRLLNGLIKSSRTRIQGTRHLPTPD